MLFIISPAKTLDYESPISVQGQSNIPFLKESKQLVKVLKKYKADDIAKLMGVSSKIAYLNYDRFAQWKAPFIKGESRQALYAFKGEVYNGLDAYSLSQEDADYAQEHMRMLSGLYGLLRPYDMILPYRLEMGTKLHTEKFRNLYEFWGDKITKNIQKAIEESGTSVLVNLASNEYFKSVNTSKIKSPIITPIFKEAKGDSYKVIAIFAKKARGLMSRYIIENKIQNPEELKHFDKEGYFFNAELSTETELTFTRG
ncbi:MULTISPECIES: peroxide stress protein YaaA [unclassified Lentimicrobium]|uniref:peroxide stress protein YaaA n=1 Tax=unclassified Lentimicrobium TaxID=2677434 RepID=UPI001552B0FE|nr:MULTISPECIES: peroxide stress protein YaaA [unclassified Lentimicrobium]NPD44537.1 peroxide stress protein YaaA [Lentimicrobium sp. S6]NPD85646.1 peroxide stress protein YaaA [Lentimicrobium sp. L6]